MVFFNDALALLLDSCVSTDTRPHRAQKHSHLSKNLNDEFGRKAERQQDFVLKYSSVNFLRLAFLSAEPRDILV